MPRRCGVAAHAGHSISATGFITNASAHLRTVRRVMSSADGPTGKPAIVDLRRAPRKRSRLQGLGALWGDSAIRDDHGRPLPVLRNVTIALRSAPAVAEAFSFDELEQLIIVKDHLPLAAGAEPRNITPPPRPLTDVDVSQLQEWLQFVGLPGSAPRSSIRRSRFGRKNARFTPSEAISILLFGTVAHGLGHGLRDISARSRDPIRTR